jgi:hypothetical protein
MGNSYKILAGKLEEKRAGVILKHILKKFVE